MLPYFCSVHVTPSPYEAGFLTSQLPRLYGSFHSPLTLPSCVPAVLISASTGISTCRPSATPSGLALGPDFPRADQLYSGNLGYSAVRILTLLSLLIPAFSRYSFRHSLFHKLHHSLRYGFVAYAMLLYQLVIRRFLGFGVVFQPRKFSARDLSTSELLRTLSMCGCF